MDLMLVVFCDWFGFKTTIISFGFGWKQWDLFPKQSIDTGMNQINWRSFGDEAESVNSSSLMKVFKWNSNKLVFVKLNQPKQFISFSK
jgi:hypothetical protein